MHTEIEEIPKRIFIYEIVHGTFYKYAHKAVDNEGVRIAFYCDNHNILIKFRNMINEQHFKDIFSKEIETIVSSANMITIYFINKSCIQINCINECSVGCRYNYAVVDKDITKEIFDCIINPMYVPYSYNSDKENIVLKYDTGIEFIDFD